ncbi:leucyl/phenylalanyl-tRNA--protein transferase [Alteromonas sp. C1M14]|uniref:leucyl/phenylalanyl-tRNA--protein transferase n=1 Tax=Alteromonas sp. C1M14 TaxID=2841567 RepID=UPI001C080EB5|nr:leucyl/phenylalanyl-tRNA--protein transferase [Alteromonas sp. C1M14]MBU2977060.1 leucyl/phenylalanyl-tRNA--protein transferase [Alteromonas sp. C1M14]
MTTLPYLSETTPFPDVANALQDPNGLLAYGGTLSVPMLFQAYSNGIFPWFSEDEPILWWSPDPRAIIELDEFHASRSLRKLARQGQYVVSLNRQFTNVIRACSSIPRRHPEQQTMSNETWITEDMIQAYCQLHQAGLAHSVEVCHVDGTLVGGLYGVAVGEVFCGESMFHLAPNTSKLAMFALVQHMKRHGLAFIDCQLPTEHLSSLGAKSLARDEFIPRLHQHNVTLAEDGKLSARYQQCWESGIITP